MESDFASRIFSVTDRKVVALKNSDYLFENYFLELNHVAHAWVFYKIILSKGCNHNLALIFLRNGKY